MGESKIINELRAEGALKEKRSALLRALQLRFRTQPPPEIVMAIQSSTNLDELSRWFDASLTTNSLEEFRAAMEL